MVGGRAMRCGERTNCTSGGALRWVGSSATSSARKIQCSRGPGMTVTGPASMRALRSASTRDPMRAGMTSAVVEGPSSRNTPCSVTDTRQPRSRYPAIASPSNCS